MAQKYTILKAITRTSNKGFTLLELLVGMIITLIVGGLAMQAFINASATFSKDKKSIDSTQNLSAVIDIIGNDIKQSGENISDTSFPTIEFNIAAATETTLMPGSSKITIRRALSEPLTLCEKILAGTAPSATTILVADTTKKGTSSNCDVGTSSSQLIGTRQSATAEMKSYELPISTDPALSFATTGSLLLPSALRKARDYRCQSYDPNPSVAYDSATTANNDFCTGAAASQKVRVAISDSNGHIIILNQKDEIAVSGTPNNEPIASIIRKYGISVEPVDSAVDLITTANNDRNKAVEYPIGSPIFLIEERVYTLSSQGDLQVSIDGGTASTLIKRIGQFNVSARGYTDATNRVINPTPAGAAVDPNPVGTLPTTANPICSNAPTATAATIQNPQYICKFNYNTAVGDAAMNWKMIAGIKIELQAKYDGTGGVSETSTAPADIAAVAAAKEKLSAAAEFFPRNVLSK
jgi:prepilin-type N-terminal cleavage/methylation domain-containing protein